MSKLKMNKSIPYITAIIIFLILSFAYFPDFLEGKKLSQHDKQTFQGSSKEIVDYNKKTGEHTLWTNSMFGGMPAYLISNHTPYNIAKYIHRYINGHSKLRPVNFIFIALLGFFIALLLFGVDPWLSIAGALAFGFSSYYLIIIEAGHLTKVSTIAYMPPIIAGVYYAYKKDKLKGSLVVMLFLALQLYRNHLQITFYTLLTALIYIIFEAVSSFRKKELKKFITASSFLTVGALVAVLVNFTNIATTFDYGKDSIRGKSELSLNKENQTSGLDKDYATAWSYGTLETFNLLIPNLYGGSSSGELSENSQMYKELKKLGVNSAGDIVKHMPTYWGPQSFTSGPVYIGAVLIFLFIFGLFIVKGNIKWWIVSATVLAILLAWGKHFMFLTDFFLDYFPGYNKFRTLSMILVIAEFTIPLLGIIAIKNIIDKKVSKKDALKALKWSVGIVSGIIIIFLINPGILSFKSETDAMWFIRSFGLKDDGSSQQLVNTFTSALAKDRASIFQADAWRSLGFILVTAALIWLFIIEKLKQTSLIIGLGVLILVDLWTIDKRYLNSDDFVAARKEKTPFKASKADEFILKDKNPDFRVLNLTVSPFNDASTSYFHKSIGGYHGAKMQRYQELITYGINHEINQLVNTLQSSTSELEIQSTLMNLSILNMLNTKYFIISPDMLPIMNKYNLGNAWFVNEIKEVDNADEEIQAVNRFNPERTAIVDKRFKDQFFKFKKDSSASIKLIRYEPNKLEYKTNTNSNQLAVFSEIYYAKGWNAYLDGKLVPHFRADYVLRTMKIPEGQHTVIFKFEPVVWANATKVSLIGSILFILLILFGIFYEVKKRKTKASENTEK